MAIKDILLQLTSYPDRTPAAVIDAAIGYAALFKARISAAIVRIAIPRIGNPIVKALTDYEAILASENARSAAAAQAMATEFADLAARLGVPCAHEILDCRARPESSELLARARLSDLTIMPVSFDRETQYRAEDVIFASGRPVLLLPPVAAAPVSIGTAVVAWDGSRVAARALGDAIPFLERAGTVRLLTITGDKPFEAEISAQPVADHLGAHGIAATIDFEDIADGDAGSAIAHYCERKGAGLLVMGAYGHSRLRDFILGGATRSILNATSLPVILSH